MWRDSTPLFFTRSRLHQLPVTVLRRSGRNQTWSACGTQTRSSVGIAAIAISGWIPGSCSIIADLESGDQIAAVDRQHDAGDEGGGRRGEEEHGARDVAR